jgi:hypothetical protein
VSAAYVPGVAAEAYVVTFLQCHEVATTLGARVSGGHAKPQDPGVERMLVLGDCHFDVQIPAWRHLCLM